MRSRCLFLFAFVLSVASFVHAQTYTGGIRGAVRQAGAVVPGATVQLINEATNVSRTTTTNEAGEYAFGDVVPGTYTLKIVLAGFKTIESKQIRVGTQQFVTMPDVSLEVGAIQEFVTVQGSSPMLESSNPSVSSTLDKKLLETLPTAGRNAFFLSVTTPNVVPSGDPQFVRQQDQTNSSLLSLGGGPRRANNYTLDGVSITDMRNRATFIPNIEAVEEVKVQVSTYDAEMGRTGGGVFNTTAKSGSNIWHGSGLYQNRPKWGQGKFFFSKNDPKPDTYFHLYGGSFGGPIQKQRTFFWSTFEGYKTKTSRNALLILPTERERNGDFSQSGVTIYDPITTRANPAGGFIRDAFDGNVIRRDRMNPISLALLQYLPLPTSGNTRPAVAELVDKANQATVRVDHRFNERYQAAVTYAWYDSEEPESRFYGKNRGDNPGDPAEGALFRTVHVVALNSTFVPAANTVWNFRYGFTSFVDDDVPNPFDPATLGFSPDFIRLIPYKKFPSINISGIGSVNFDTFGDRDPQDTTYYSHTASVSSVRLVGRHNVKFGGDYRVIGMKLFARGQPSGNFDYDANFTRGPNPLAAATGTGSAFASFLLGFPATGDITVGAPNNFFINYYGGYVQDDFRIHPDLTLNLGLRYEFEQGLQERDNHITVGFDRDRAWDFQVPGVTLRGGLMYAGVGGYHTYQGDPSKAKFAPRIGFAWSMGPITVVRGGYGRFWSPNQYAFPNENRLGTRGFTAITTYVASTNGGLSPCAGCSITNPFPNGIEQPRGSTDGLNTGAGGTVHFVDQFRKSAYVDQYSVDLQRELNRSLVVSAGYVGSRSERLSVGGTNSNTVNINQLDPRYLALGTTLLDQVANPFFGDARFGAFGRQATISRGQLLRPYPQFGDIQAHQVSAGKARYHSVILKAQRRITNGWGFNVNYTWSSNKDNLFGEVNYFSNNTNGLARALNNYDLDAEYSTSLLHTPHRLNIVGTYELPFGDGKRWVNEAGLARALLDGWAVTVVGAYQSGFPVVVVQDNNNSGLFGSFQRPNVTGIDPKSSGSTEDRLSHWFNPAAWSLAAPYTFGNAPRTDTRARTPVKKQTDIAIQRTVHVVNANTVMIRAEIINVFDDPNFLGPATRFGRADFGQITQLGGFARMVQVTVRYSF